MRLLGKQIEKLNSNKEILKHNGLIQQIVIDLFYSIIIIIEHFIVWARTAGTEGFRKLYGKIETDIKKSTTLNIRIKNSKIILLFILMNFIDYN